jgi:hypothetical protein
MDRFFRRLFWVALLTFPLLACQPQGGGSTPESTTSSLEPTVLSRREYTVRQRLTLTNEGPGQPEKQNLWVALIQTVPPYQEVLSVEVTPKNSPWSKTNMATHTPSSISPSTLLEPPK